MNTHIKAGTAYEQYFIIFGLNAHHVLFAKLKYLSLLFLFKQL